jgi:electron transport complex protein RnfD
MQFKTVTSPHSSTDNNVAKVMRHVVVAVLPGTLALCWFFGVGVITNIIIAVTTAWISEAAILLLRKRPVISTLKDNSALLSAWLLAIALPPIAPWWLVAIGTAFAIIFAKQLYGGLGYNPFNPAMVGYVVLLVSFPVEMTQWLSPRALSSETLSIRQIIDIQLFGQLPVGGWDAISGATPLDKIKTELASQKTISEIMQAPLFAVIAGKGWLWVNLYFLLGGIFLIRKRIITWHTPASMLTALFIISSLFYLVDSERHASPLLHLFSGAAMLGAFFIATDPVSSCTSNKGKLFYGAGIGLITYIIRSWAGYPDGVAFAVLFMNLAAPFIDYYCKPRVFGQPS